MSASMAGDFGSPWEMSDVVLNTENSCGKELHASKAVLGAFSHYFRAMFFSGFTEAKASSVDVHCEYKVMKEILGIIHQTDRNFSSSGQKLYDPNMLIDLYKAGDMMDFPIIRKLCQDQMLDRPCEVMASCAVTVGLKDVFMTILDFTATLHERRQIFSHQLDSPLLFSKKDVSLIYKKITWADLPKSVIFGKKEVTALSLEGIFKELENPRIDVGHKWELSDLLILTPSSAGRMLYSNKAVLAMFSPYFHKMFFGSDEQIPLEKEDDVPVIHVDVEYTTIRAILQILHQCNTDFSLNGGFRRFHPVLLYDMYCTANEDHLDIPTIRKLCVDNLLEQKTAACLEVAIKLKLDDVKTKLVLRGMMYPYYCDWLFSDGMDLCYLKDGQEVAIGTDQTADVLSFNDVRVIINRVLSLYDNKLNKGVKR